MLRPRAGIAVISRYATRSRKASNARVARDLLRERAAFAAESELSERRHIARAWRSSGCRFEAVFCPLRSLLDTIETTRHSPTALKAYSRNGLTLFLVYNILVVYEVIFSCLRQKKKAPRCCLRS